jgi:hypothetical protein
MTDLLPEPALGSRPGPGEAPGDLPDPGLPEPGPDLPGDLPMPDLPPAGPELPGDVPGDLPPPGPLAGPLAGDLPAAARRALAEAAARRQAAAELRLPPERGGRAGPEPVRFGDWELKGLAVDF